MADPYLGEIRMFAGNFAPRGWAFCHGQRLAIANNQALFALIGVTFGGDGVADFALPDLRDRTPVGVGQGPGLSNHELGAQFGASTVTLQAEHLPTHQHPLLGSQAEATTADPHGGVPARGVDPAYGPPGEGVLGSLLGSTGDGLPHANRPPSLGIQFIIAINGVFPQ